MNRSVSSVFVALASMAALWAQTSNDVPPQLRNVRIEQKLDSQIPLDLAFVDADGRHVTLRELMRGKPVVLSLVYYECPRLCSMTLTGLLKAMRAMPLDVGRDYDIITVSFDPREGPRLAHFKKAAYVERYGRDGAAQGWSFLTGEKREIGRLTSAAGFGFEFDASRNQFAHASAIMVLTPDGRVSRYLFGLEFAPRDLRLALVEASEGRIGSVIDQALLFCFDYDPHTGKYSMTILTIIRIAGVITVAAVVCFVLWGIRRDRKRSRRVREALTA
jgi:protein SCO1